MGVTMTGPSLPPAVDRSTFQAELDMLRVREKAHTREGAPSPSGRDSKPGAPTTSAVHLRETGSSCW
jgi:hypothetical protein